MNNNSGFAVEEFQQLHFKKTTSQPANWFDKGSEESSTRAKFYRS